MTRISPRRTAAMTATILIGCAFVGRPALCNEEQPEREANLNTHFAMVEVDGRYHPYRIFFPKSYVFAPSAAGQAVQKFPLVVACHAGGGDEHWYFEWKGSADRIQTAADKHGYVVVCPAAPSNGRWHKERDLPNTDWESLTIDDAAETYTPTIILATIREVVRQRHIDKNRIYLMGASSGCVATYATAARHADQFAAIAGVCGFCTADAVPELAKTPILMINAKQDVLISVDWARRMSEQIKAAGGELKYVEFPGRHGGYRNDDTYELIFDWFDAHK